jgi:hypothetical protein
MIRTKGGLIFVSLIYMFAPALLVHINGTLGTVIDMGSGFFAADGTFHDLLTQLSFPFCPNPSGLALFPFSSLESVT